MLCANNYPQKYVDGCQARINQQVIAFKKMGAVAGSDKAVKAALESFEPIFFNNMVLELEMLFVHRTRAIEKKDGNPLNEVRMLCNSIMNNNNKMTADSTIKYDLAKSVLKYQFGEEIKLNLADFSLLSKAFFTEIESKYL